MRGVAQEKREAMRDTIYERRDNNEWRKEKRDEGRGKRGRYEKMR